MIGNMRRFARCVFNFVAGVSLLVCGTSILLWVNSKLRHDILYTERRQVYGPYFKSSRTELRFEDGRLVVAWGVEECELPLQMKTHPRSGTQSYAGNTDLPWADASPRGLQWKPGNAKSFWTSHTGAKRTSSGLVYVTSGAGRWWVISYAQGTFLGGLPFLYWGLRRLRDRLDVPPGLCPVCRYDLRATPNRCPECGHVPEDSHASRGA
jgi:hypothetical protein